MVLRNGEEKRSGALEWSNITGGAKGICIEKAPIPGWVLSQKNYARFPRGVEGVEYT